MPAEREMGPGLVEGPRSNCESEAQSGVRMLPSPSPGLPSISMETPIPTPVPSADLVGVIHGAPDTEGGICPVILQDDAGERWEVYLGDAYSREYQDEVMVILGSDDEIIARSGDRVGFNIDVDESLGSFCMAGIPVTATDIVFVQRPGN